MKRTIRNILFVVFLVILMVVTGCVTGRPLEKMGLIVAMGVDLLPTGRIMGTAALYGIDPNAKDKVAVLTNTANTLKGIRTKQNQEFSNRLVSGQLRVVLFGSPLAQHGIVNLVDTLARDAEIGTGVYLAVSQDNSSELLKNRFPEISNIGTFLYEQIQQNSRHEELISTTLHEFLHDFYSVGKDPVMPLFHYMNNEVHMSDIALFRDDKMVGHFNAQESFYLKLIRDRYKAGTSEIALRREVLDELIPKKSKYSHDDMFYVVISNLESKAKIKLIRQNPPTFQITLHAVSQVHEISEEISLGTKDVIRKLEISLNQEMKKNIEKLIARTQKLNTDPIGFGEQYRSSVRYSNLTREKWRRLYPKAEFMIIVHNTLSRTGIMD
ncbi:Ger(x)C family spore germination protein [Brevibacillus laterosporus]|uniref:Ger(X)C family spore germination protein n=1 Tax=Brevibacillus laterosporus TaxID=1465 RepID=A0AAP3DH15_BRELA|nr:Ger(x)C family spore germination protein [Brevibacillus laterosporus]MCR8981185.1 Ger(x)C family spore germination protein [Brevibacillus laterosporus]MCZ0808339.1 Ger(x)C family spore germination protein [Brevibacillus laterosporus]MCZ0826737.1 Ger(x)C family spore germination protein [Brevibacillus laterosporus]MCZ0850550.1 Ger(x)C family spore germination protein [Brevibacillus laterosporus]